MSAHALSDADLQTLSSQAIAAKSKAYCPNSNFHVGACLLTTSGTFIAGANIENASYPVGVCAERVAFGTAIFNGHRSFKALAVATDTKPGASPCGMCRQFMREFTPPSFPIYMYDAEGKYKVTTIGELLPDSFGPDDLNSARGV
ncbi:cytidine deaminase [Talaromyces proteolyticus]|uniref:Cytidine deaminase n=1 Tax=Talaromyces proteolyticus TaxID=1131652 RepID=A0AAD4KDL0_9EURO|nr:cytidine deaminase [Talaromyces proteolyticus]KAH8689200.1 cytidine deaminase [Talaromyces proteolyticus]